MKTDAAAAFLHLPTPGEIPPLIGRAVAHLRSYFEAPVAFDLRARQGFGRDDEHPPGAADNWSAKTRHRLREKPKPAPRPNDRCGEEGFWAARPPLQGLTRGPFMQRHRSLLTRNRFISSCRISICMSGCNRLRSFSRCSGSMLAKSRTIFWRDLYLEYLPAPIPMASNAEIVQTAISVLLTIAKV